MWTRCSLAESSEETIGHAIGSRGVRHRSHRRLHRVGTAGGLAAAISCTAGLAAAVAGVASRLAAGHTSVASGLTAAVGAAVAALLR